ncbi:MAG: DNA polymerase III, subunit gamma and tau, partial [Candidatus Fraserbacteria bacterium RBG_16_55_9]
ALDVIEIDGASNRGIDQIRQLREEVCFAPAQSRYKIYIIDEVHMLTNEAFNALLKTLEEPPERVIFIFATTEPHKVPLTVLSRCQAFEFKNIPQEKIETQLVEIAKSEGFQVDASALHAIARHARGALRDAEVLLEQLVSYKGKSTIVAQDLYEVLGLPSQEVLDEFLRALLSRDGAKALQIISDLAERGRDFELFLEELLHRSRDVLVNLLHAKTSEFPGNTEDWVRLTSQLLEIKRSMRYAFDKRMFLEVKALEVAGSSPTPPPAAEARPSPAPPAQSVKPQKVEKPKQAPLASPSRKKAGKTSVASGPVAKATPRESAPAQAAEIPHKQEGTHRWQELLERVKKERIAVHALLTEAQIREGEGALVIEYSEEYGFHKDRLEQPENLQFIHSLIREIYGDIQLKIAFSQEKPRSEAPEKSKAETLREKAELVRKAFDGEIRR